jgi:hypothetical protein
VLFTEEGMVFYATVGVMLTALLGGGTAALLSDGSAEARIFASVLLGPLIVAWGTALAFVLTPFRQAGAQRGVGWFLVRLLSCVGALLALGLALVLFLGSVCAVLR